MLLSTCVIDIHYHYISIILVAGLQANRRPVLSSWHNANRKRTISIDLERSDRRYPRSISMATVTQNYPLALRPDPNVYQPTVTAVTAMKTCDTAGYLEFIHRLFEVDDNDKNNDNDNNVDDVDNDDDESKGLAIRSKSYSTIDLPTHTLFISSVFLGAVIVLLIWYYKEKFLESLRQYFIKNEIHNCTELPLSPTTDYHQLEQPLIPSFQSR
jgi:hypothetical protein